jgi:hypothetical protein
MTMYLALLEGVIVGTVLGGLMGNARRSRAARRTSDPHDRRSRLGHLSTRVDAHTLLTP